jgi:hypothetical protein
VALLVALTKSVCEHEVCTDSWPWRKYCRRASVSDSLPLREAVAVTRVWRSWAMDISTNTDILRKCSMRSSLRGLPSHFLQRRMSCFRTLRAHRHFRACLWAVGRSSRTRSNFSDSPDSVSHQPSTRQSFGTTPMSIQTNFLIHDGKSVAAMRNRG